MSGTTRVRLPDGSYVNVPTDNTQAAAAAARKHWDNRPQPKPTTFLGRLDGALNTFSDMNDSFVDSVLPNFGDEIRGAGRAARALWNGKPVGPAFREGQRSFHADQVRLERDHPTLRTGAQTAGVLASVALPAGKALKGASLAQKARQGAQVGALYGAASGAGEGDGLDLQRRATNAGSGALAGAVTGAVLPVGIAGARGGAQLARMHLPGVDRATTALARVPQAILRRTRGPQAPMPSAAVAQANRMAAARMHEGTIATGQAHTGPQATPQAITAEVERRNQVGVPAMIGDTTQPMRDLTQWSSRGAGPGQLMVRDSLERRQAQQGQRVRQHVQETLPTTPDPIQFMETAKREAREAAAPLYRQAYDQPMYVSPEIDGIMATPAFRDAIPQARRNVQNQLGPDGRPLDPVALGFHHEDGVTPQLSTEGFDQVTRAMSDNGRAASTINPVTGRLDSTTNSVHINQRTADLRRLMGEQNEPYRQAVSGYGDDMTHANAFGMGQDVGKLTGHEINAQGRQLPQSAHGTWAAGAGTVMADGASQYGAKHPTGNVARHVQQALGDDMKQQAIGEVAGNTGGVRNLQDRLEFEHQGHLNFRAAYGNSSTAANQQLDSDLGQMAAVPFTASGIRDRLVNFVASHAAPKFQGEVKARIAEIVTASGAQDVQSVLRSIEEQAAKDRGFANMLHRAGVGTTAAYGTNVKPIDPIEGGNYRGY